MSDEHQCAVDCQESGCYRTADNSFCEKHYKKEIEAAKQEGRDEAWQAVKDTMEKEWEPVTDTDNPTTIVDIKNGLLKAIEEIP